MTSISAGLGMAVARDLDGQEWMFPCLAGQAEATALGWRVYSGCACFGAHDATDADAGAALNRGVTQCVAT